MVLEHILLCNFINKRFGCRFLHGNLNAEYYAGLQLNRILYTILNYYDTNECIVR